MVQESKIGTGGKVLMGSAGAVGAVAAVSGLAEVGKVRLRPFICLRLPSYSAAILKTPEWY